MDFDLKFTEEELQVLNDGLVELPFRRVARLINSINTQIQQQRQQKPENADAPINP